jgi:Family of unknown function (DUF5985)
MAAWAPVVYLLCLLASMACAGLLIRGYLRTKGELLLASGACFVLLALNNLLLVVDLVLLPTEVDLAIPRVLASLGAVSVLLCGFIWETD